MNVEREAIFLRWHDQAVPSDALTEEMRARSSKGSPNTSVLPSPRSEGRPSDSQAGHVRYHQYRKNGRPKHDRYIGHLRFHRPLNCGARLAWQMAPKMSALSEKTIAASFRRTL